MNEVDLAILLILGLSIYHNVSRGALIGVVDLASLLLALGLGAFAWPAPAALLRAIGLPASIAGLSGFLIVVMGIAFAGSYFGLRLLRNAVLPRWLDRAGGGLCGAVFGLALASLVLIISGALPNAYKPITRSAFGLKLAAVVPASIEGMERLGVALPKLVMLPLDYRDELRGVRKGLQFMQINFSQLDGAVCIKCRHRVRFEGYGFSRGTLLSPRFRCPSCGRTSDGCQTFEGFHRIYGRCPVELAREGTMFDCGVWTNGDFVAPNGPCPVDGNTLSTNGGHAPLPQGVSEPGS